jgi:VanZ family protein
MLGIFSNDSVHKNRAKFIAVLWTSLIFLGCFLPSKKIPHVSVPLADKWVHFVLFGGFTFLWLLTVPKINYKTITIVLLLGIVLGVVVELLQGILVFLGRSAEAYDVIADSLGALLGVIVFILAMRVFGKTRGNAS